MGINKIMICLFSGLPMLTQLNSCTERKYEYFNDPQNTSRIGVPFDSLAYYFISSEPIHSNHISTVDSFQQDFLGSNLFAVNEPHLYNYYLGKNIYRFLWIRSFHSPMVFVLSNSSGEVRLRIKKLDRHPLTRDIRYHDIASYDSLYKDHKIEKEIITDNGKQITLSLIKADRRAHIIYDTIHKLSIREWNKFGKLLKQANFEKLQSYQWDGEADGSAWVIEEHLKDQYRFVSGKDIYKPGKFLIELSGLKEEIY